MKNKIVKLKNLYTGEIVLSEEYQNFQKVNDVEFIRVYSQTNPSRKFLVNRNAFEVVKTK